MEKYCVLNGFDNYAISNRGNVINVKSRSTVKQVENNNGYLTVGLCQNSIKKNFRVHRLVALYFIPNEHNKPSVNHLDGNKQNNHQSNLEWCTAKENDLHARSNGLKEQNKPIISRCLEDGTELVFDSVSEASGVLGINKGTISKVLSGKRNKTHNHTFEYLTNGSV